MCGVKFEVSRGVCVGSFLAIGVVLTGTLSAAHLPAQQITEQTSGESPQAEPGGTDEIPAEQVVALEELVAGLKKTEAAIQSLSVDYKFDSSNYYTKPGEPLPEIVLKDHLIQDDAVASFTKGKVSFLTMADGRYRTQLEGQRTSQRFDGSEVHHKLGAVVVFDGKLSRDLHIRDIGDGRRITEVRARQAKFWYSPHPFQFTVNHLDDPVSKVLDTDGGYVIGHMSWEDSKTVVVETKPTTRDDGYRSKRRYWIDPSRNFIVVRRQVLEPKSDDSRWSVHHQVDGRQHKEVEPGIWLPMEVETTNYSVPEDKARHLVGKDVLKIRKWQVNAMPDDDSFQLD